MITNAILISIARPLGTATGSTRFATAASIAKRCAMSDVNQSHRVVLGAVIGDATAVLDILKSDLADEPQRGAKVIAAIDRSAQKHWRVVHVANKEMSGGLAHWKLFLQELLES